MFYSVSFYHLRSLLTPFLLFQSQGWRCRKSFLSLSLPLIVNCLALTTYSFPFSLTHTHTLSLSTLHPLKTFKLESQLLEMLHQTSDRKNTWDKSRKASPLSSCPRLVEVYVGSISPTCVQMDFERPNSMNLKLRFNSIFMTNFSTIYWSLCA